MNINNKITKFSAKKHFGQIKFFKNYKNLVSKDVFGYIKKLKIKNNPGALLR